MSEKQPTDDNRNPQHEGASGNSPSNQGEDIKTVLLRIDDMIDFLEKRESSMKDELNALRAKNDKSAEAARQRMEGKLKADFVKALNTLEDEARYAQEMMVSSQDASLKSLAEGVIMIHKSALQAAGVESFKAQGNEDNPESATDTASKTSAAPKGKAKKRSAGALLAAAQTSINPFANTAAVQERAENALALADEYGDQDSGLAERSESLKTLMQSIAALTNEYDQSKKGQQAAKDKVEKYGVEKPAKKFIEVADNMDRALQVVENSGEDLTAQNDKGRLYEGLKNARQSLLDAFAAHNITREEPMGEKMDPHSHQAVQAMPQDGAEKDTVINVMAPGYRLHDRILRPAMVVVAQ